LSPVVPSALWCSRSNTVSSIFAQAVIGPWPLGPAVSDSGGYQVATVIRLPSRRRPSRLHPSFSPWTPGGCRPVDHPPEGSLPVGRENGSFVQPHLYQNVKSNAVWHRWAHHNPEMTPDLRSYLRSTQGCPEVVRSCVRHRSAKLLFEIDPSYATLNYPPIALTRRSRGLVRDPDCAALASPSYGPAAGSASPVLMISAPDRIVGYRVPPRMPRLTLQDSSSPPSPWVHASWTAGSRPR